MNIAIYMACGKQKFNGMIESIGGCVSLLLIQFLFIVQMEFYHRFDTFTEDVEREIFIG